jgi:integrase
MAQAVALRKGRQPLTQLCPAGRDRAGNRPRAGLPRIRLYDLRHDWAPAALRAGLHARLVQEVLRHSDYRTAAEIYTHVMPNAKR